jgi:exodeoxyribonuclease V gamma subunit
MSSASTTSDTSLLPPGLIVLHSNRCEDLMSTVAAWLERHPLPPMVMETILVQSNGMGEWVKTELARLNKVCAATEVQLPARFMWKAYRQVLGADQVPRWSPMDEAPMIWRLLRQLPALLADEHLAPSLAPIARFLTGDEDDRLYQLACQLADLFDQYQVYRPDWLQAWGQGHSVLIDGRGQTQPLPADQEWQSLLWRTLLDELDDSNQRSTRAALHPIFIEKLNTTSNLAFHLPPRIVVFGMSHFPLGLMEAMAALSRHCQVLIAMPNPCRFHWADALDGRELLRLQRRRLPLKHGKDLCDVPVTELHTHAHPLLAAWGKAARDCLRMLDRFDDVAQTQAQFDLGRLDLFDDTPSNAETPLLTQVQHDIRDLVPVAERIEHPPPPWRTDDHSIVFHVAHSPIRELEVLHNRLLDLLASGDLEPRDIVVMMPDVGAQDANIRAVFGQYARNDPRHIPYHITDQHLRHGNPMLHALEWLLHLPQGRGKLSELAAFMEVPEVAQAARLSPEDVPHLTQWMQDAGIRWGLNAQHRQQLGLDSCGDQNTAWFGLQRMLLGYASGDAGLDQAPPPQLEDITPLPDIGGLEAHQVGALAHVLHHLDQWHTTSATPATATEWGTRAQGLLTALFAPVDELGRKTMRALQTALHEWQRTCELAACTEALPLSVFRHAWLKTLDEPQLQRRFRVGGVTFCTLMPMRAIPFEVVCLLGMNDGDYPRRTHRLDFDLMGLPGQQRPGDRSRRDDDRQLMLEALLSARRVLYVSWCGRSPRDNSEQPPSVLVSQLRDHLARLWGDDVLGQLTTHHPLQSFSPRGFGSNPALRTWTREWAAAHQTPLPSPSPPTRIPSSTSALPHLSLRNTDDAPLCITLTQLQHYFNHPAKTWFRQQLGVVFDESANGIPDDEPFGLDGLEVYQLLQDTALPLSAYATDGQDVQRIEQRLAYVQRSGRLPLGSQAQRLRQQTQHELESMLGAWRAAMADVPHPAPRHRLHWQAPAGPILEDWLDQLHHAENSSTPVCLMLTASKIFKKTSSTKSNKEKRHNDKKLEIRIDKMLAPWLMHLAALSHGVLLEMRIVARDGSMHISPHLGDNDLEQACCAAQQQLNRLLEAYQQGQPQALPLPFKTALAWVAHAQEPEKAHQAATRAYDGDGYQTEGEAADPYWQRLWPSADHLLDTGTFCSTAIDLYQPLYSWVHSGAIQFQAYANNA